MAGQGQEYTNKIWWDNHTHALYIPTLVCVLCGTAIPTSFYQRTNINFNDFMDLPYMYVWKFSLGKNFTKTSYIPLYYRKIWWNKSKFATAKKGHHIILFAILLNTGQKISVIKFLPMREGGRIGENFLLVKISTYMVQFYPSGNAFLILQTCCYLQLG